MNEVCDREVCDCFEIWSRFMIFKMSIWHTINNLGIDKDKLTDTPKCGI